MLFTKPQPVESTKNLRERVERLFNEPITTNNSNQLSLDLFTEIDKVKKVEYPTQNITTFLNFIVDAMPEGELYLFGGVLRDLALLGRKGFNSDIDLVVEGDWSNLTTYLEFLNADKNKFGGYRLVVDGWPIDIWKATETWAIKKGYVQYQDITSLTKTTVLNWDAILMNWRTRNFIYRKNYFEELSLRTLNIVLEENPNPIGMAVRVFRHLCLKDAKKITKIAIKYLANSANTYNYEELQKAEFKSYGNNVIGRELHRFFENINPLDDINIHHQFSVVSSIVEQELNLQ